MVAKRHNNASVGRPTANSLTHLFGPWLLSATGSWNATRKNAIWLLKCHPKSFWLLKGYPKRHSLLSMGYLCINLKQWKIVSVCSLKSLPCLPTLLSQPCLSRRLYCICFKLFRFPLADYLTTTARSAPLCSYPGLGIHMGITGLSNLLSIMCKCENVIFGESFLLFFICRLLIIFHMSAPSFGGDPEI